jgi:hypothetical protein
MAGDDDILVDEVEDVEDIDVDVDDDVDVEELDDDDIDDDEDVVDDDVEFEADSDDDDEFSDDDDDDEEEEEDDDAPVALDVLEAEELEIVESDATDTMLVDEASEIRAIRREEMTMDIDAGAPQSDEFVCQSCFLVLKSSQLANKRKRLCFDCA